MFRVGETEYDEIHSPTPHLSGVTSYVAVRGAIGSLDLRLQYSVSGEDVTVGRWYGRDRDYWSPYLRQSVAEWLEAQLCEAGHDVLEACLLATSLGPLLAKCENELDFWLKGLNLHGPSRLDSTKQALGRWVERLNVELAGLADCTV